MPSGRHTALVLHLTDAERQSLEHWTRAPRLPQRLARRAQIMLLRADGVPIVQIAAQVGLARRHVYKWLTRFQRRRLGALTTAGPYPRVVRGAAKRHPSHT
jgi:CRP-like cAMP-binding protein